MADYPFLVDDERRTRAEETRFVEYAIVLHDLPLEIAEEWERHADFLRECGVGRRAVDADPEYLCFSSFEFGDISLIRLKLSRSATGEGEHVKRKHDILGSLEAAQRHLFAFCVWQGEVGRRVAYFQVRLGCCGLLGERNHVEDEYSDKPGYFFAH